MSAYQVPRLWPDSTVVILGGGPSLTPEDVAVVKDASVRVIAVNNAYQIAPWADVLYACDAKWWKWHNGVPEFAGLKFALQPAAGRWPGVQVLRNTGDEGLEANPSGLRTGRNSGAQAINLAVHLGASRILLLGFDMQRGAGGRSHWHGDHPDRSAPPFALCLAGFRSMRDGLRQAGVQVVNCSRRTALDVFPRMSLEEALCCAS